MKFHLHLTEEDIRNILHRYISQNYAVRLTRDDVKIYVAGIAPEETHQTLLEARIELEKASLA